MLKHFINLEWKAFARSAAFRSNLVIRIVLILAALYFGLMFVLLGAGLYFILSDAGMDPLATVNKYLIYYFAADLFFRYFLQKMPVVNIKPLLVVPVSRSTIVHFALGKSIISFFNFIHAFFLIPFAVVLITKGYAALSVAFWIIGIYALIYCSNFINVLVNNKDRFFYPAATIVSILAISQYYSFFDITDYTSGFFSQLFSNPLFVLIPIAAIAALYGISFSNFRSQLHLDTGLAKKSDVAHTEDFAWLNKYGTLGTFLKNDIRLLKRNKRSRATVMMSVLFLFYGLLFFSKAIEVYQNPAMQVFAGIFVSGGFLFTFGQFVPSWDSSYYQLMMSQNIQYRDYLSSKWWLIVIATAVATVLASFYLYFGWHTYMLIVVGAIYNIGVNSHLVLLGGAYVKTPIDLTSSKGAFGDKQAFNIKTLLISIPKLLVPMLLYAAGFYIFSAEIGFLFVASAGVLGFAFRNRMFTLIERIYRAEKYKTLDAYKQKN
ncbi:MAG TPA: DUF5687 family protein [Flavobacterium sp.]|jgi:hypothetical protein